MSAHLPTIDLIAFEGLGLIIRWPSGVAYTTQSAGFACEHPVIEGVMIPLFDGIGHLALHAIRQHFRGDWHEFTDQDADILDGILRRNQLQFIQLDRGRLTESKEAWVFVVLSDDDSQMTPPRLRGFGSCSGILTWPNSD